MLELDAARQIITTSPKPPGEGIPKQERSMTSRSAVLIRVARHGAIVQTYAFDQDLIRIGRDRRSDLVLPSKDVSRIHCRLEREGCRVSVTDVGSSNGTLLNGRPIGLHEVESGDSIRIGDFTLWVELVVSHGVLPGEVLDHENQPTVPRKS